jgi:hypothetical protein
MVVPLLKAGDEILLLALIEPCPDRRIQKDFHLAIQDRAQVGLSLLTKLLSPLDLLIRRLKGKAAFVNRPIAKLLFDRLARGRRAHRDLAGILLEGQ